MIFDDFWGFIYPIGVALFMAYVMFHPRKLP